MKYVAFTLLDLLALIGTIPDANAVVCARGVYRAPGGSLYERPALAAAPHLGGGEFRLNNFDTCVLKMPTRKGRNKFNGTLEGAHVEYLGSPARSTCSRLSDARLVHEHLLRGESS